MSDLILCYSPIFPIRIENENSSHEDTVFDINHDTIDNNKTINDNNNNISNNNNNNHLSLALHLVASQLRSKGSTNRAPRFKSQLHNLLAMRPWPSY